MSAFEFSNRKMREGENPNNFIDYMVKTGRTLGKSDEEIVSSIFCNATHKFQQMMLYQKTKTIPEARSAATCVVASELSERNHVTVAPVATPAETVPAHFGYMQQQIDNLTQQMQHMNEQLSHQQQRPPVHQGYRGFNSHNGNNRYTQRKERPQATQNSRQGKTGQITCYNCRKIGHKQSECRQQKQSCRTCGKYHFGFCRYANNQ